MSLSPREGNPAYGSSSVQPPSPGLLGLPCGGLGTGRGGGRGGLQQTRGEREGRGLSLPSRPFLPPPRSWILGTCSCWGGGRQVGEGHQLRGEGIEGARPEATALPFPQPACPPPPPTPPSFLPSRQCLPYSCDYSWAYIYHLFGGG